MGKKLWNRDYILMLQGNAVSALGDILYSVAIGYWVYEKTGSSTLMGIMSSISMFMNMIVLPFSGSIIDRCNRKAVIVGMDALRGVIMLSVGLLAAFGRLSIPAVLLVAFLASLCAVFFNPAVDTLMLDIIPHDDMVRGQSILGGVDSFLNLVGKAISGALIAWLGVSVVILLNGVSFLCSAVTEGFVHVPQTCQQGEPVTIKCTIQNMRIGISTVLRDPHLRLFVFCALASNLLGAGSMSLMLPFVLGKGFGVDTYGLIMSVETFGSLLCVVLLGIVKLSPKQRYGFMAAGFIASGIFYITGYLADQMHLLAGMLFLGCFFNTLGNSVFSSVLMLALPEQNRGAILGFFSAGATGGCALSAVLYGFLCDRYPIEQVFIAGTVLCAPIMLFMCLNKATRQFMMRQDGQGSSNLP